MCVVLLGIQFVKKKKKLSVFQLESVNLYSLVDYVSLFLFNHEKWIVRSGKPGLKKKVDIDHKISKE